MRHSILLTFILFVNLFTPLSGLSHLAILHSHPDFTGDNKNVTHLKLKAEKFYTATDGNEVSVSAEGMINGFHLGTATITVRAENNPVVKSSCEVTVIAEIDPEELVAKEVAASMKKVADWQMANFTYSGTGHDYGIAAWTHATFYLGLYEWTKIASNSAECYNWLNDIGAKTNWTLQRNYYPYHADELCIGQFNIAMYKKYHEEKMLQSIKDRADYIIANPPSDQSMKYTNKQQWTWCDAIFMAPPVYAELALLTQEGKYFQYLDNHYKKLYDHLYDKDAKLFYRDDSYFDKKEANGEKVFWGRGNGWAVAGTANILRTLPDNAEYRQYYEKIFRELALNLIKLQNRDGAWHASLLDPDSYPAPETSATALITYALAYGLNNNLLTKDEAYKSIAKAWHKMGKAILENGKLGYVQPVGQDPKTVTKDMTATFGVGAFLLAGTEIYKYLNQETGMVATNNKNVDCK